MEFNVLPHAKILSPTSRSASAAVAKSDNKANQSNSQTINVVVANKGDDEPSVSISTQQLSVKEPQPEPVKEPATNENPNAIINFLRLVLESYINNPIKYNGLIICTVPLLEQLIETLTGCDDCSVELGDPDIECCKAAKILPISKIWCRNGESSEIFKYKYSQYLQVFESYKISLKLVYVE